MHTCVCIHEWVFISMYMSVHAYICICACICACMYILQYPPPYWSRPRWLCTPTPTYWKASYAYVTCTVKSRLSERQLSETTGLFEDNGQSRLLSLLSIAIKLPIIRISIIRKNQFFEVIRRSRFKKLLLNYPSRFEVQKSRMVISLFGRVRFTHLSDLANKVATGNWHRINVHTITWWTVKWVNGVFY